MWGFCIVRIFFLYRMFVWQKIPIRYHPRVVGEKKIGNSWRAAGFLTSSSDISSHKFYIYPSIYQNYIELGKFNFSLINSLKSTKNLFLEIFIEQILISPNRLTYIFEVLRRRPYALIDLFSLAAMTLTLW